MKVIILAGGKGTRLPVSAKDRPKAMVKIGNKSVLERQIEHLSQYGLNDIRLSLGWMAEHIIDFIKARFPHIEYVIEDEPRGTGGALKYALGDYDKPFIGMNGDVLTDCDMAEFLSASTPNTMALARVKNAKDYGIARVHNNVISEFKEKPGTITPGLINAGIYYLEPAFLKEFPLNCFSIERDVFPALIKQKLLRAYIHKGFWIDMGTEERLASLKNHEFFKE